MSIELSPLKNPITQPNNTHLIQNLKQVQKIIESLPIVDTKKIADIKKKILSRDYQINSDTIARKIIAFERLQ